MGWRPREAAQRLTRREIQELQAVLWIRQAGTSEVRKELEVNDEIERIREENRIARERGTLKTLPPSPVSGDVSRFMGG